ncbi:hypothetical protein BH09VER1_BH09VER1_31120 [soil metagenome]
MAPRRDTSVRETAFFKAGENMKKDTEDFKRSSKSMSRQLRKELTMFERELEPSELVAEAETLPPASREPSLDAQ